MLIPIKNLKIRESDSAPSVADVREIVIPNGLLTDNGSGVVTLNVGSGYGSVTSVDVTSASPGISFSGGPITSSGTITATLGNDLAALESLNSTGFSVRTATETWDLRTITGTANELTVTNGNGVSGNPTLSLPSAITLTGKTLTGGTFATPALSSYIDFTETAVPSTPSSLVKRMFVVDDNGFSALETISSDGAVIRLGQDTYRVARNTSGSSITLGQIVCFTGSTGQVPNVSLARANSTTTMPCVAVAIATVANNARGRFIVVGRVTGLDTSAFAEGDSLYVSSTVAGAYTTTPPSHPNYTQSIGTVERSHATQGIILFNIAPTMGGRDSGTNQNDFTIGDELAGAKSVKFDNGFIATLSSNPTANRTLTLPDATGTIALTSNLSSYQPLDATLTSLAAYNTNGILVQTAADTFTGRTITAGTAISVSNGDGVSGNPTITNTGVTALAGTANQIIASGSTGSITLSTPQNIHTAATPTFAQITISGSVTNATDVATKQYVDNLASGLDPKASVRVATTANITLSGTQTIDGVAVIANDRVLVKDQSTGADNGIYVCAAGAWSRSTDADVSSEVTSGLYVFVQEGTANASSGWILTTADPITLGSTALTFVQFTGLGQITAGAGLTKTGSTLDVGTASSARIVVNANDIDLATTGVSASTYKSVTVDAYGRVTAGTNPTTLAGYGIVDAQPLDSTLTSLAAYNTNGILTQTAADTFVGRTITGTSNRLTVTNGDGVSGNPTLDISSSYVGQSTITTLGTITTGTWNGTLIGVGYGGTGTSTTFTAGSVVFAGASGVYSQDNANFFWDDTNNRLGIGTSSPGQKLHVVGNTRVESGNLLMTGDTSLTWDGTAYITSGTSTDVILGSATYGTIMRLNGSSGNVGIGEASPGARLQINAGVSTTIGLIIKGAASQTSPLQRWNNSAGTTLSHVDATGNFLLGDSVAGRYISFYNSNYKITASTGLEFHTADTFNWFKSATLVATLSQSAGESTLKMPTFSINNSNDISCFGSLDNIYACIVGNLGNRTDASSLWALSATGGYSNVTTFTWSPNAANTATYIVSDLRAILNPGASNSGGNFYGQRVVVTETATTGLTFRKLFSGGVGTPASYTERFYVDTTGNVVFQGTTTGNGSGLTDLNASALTTGTVSSALLDATLTSLAAYNTNGILTQTAADTFTGRTITGTASRLSVTNGNGVSGNPTLDIDVAYVGQSSITTTGTLTSGATGAGFTLALGTSTLTGDLPFANLTQGSALSVLGVTGNSTADVASIAAGSDHQVLRRSGTSLAFGAINLASSAAVTGILLTSNLGSGTASSTTCLAGNSVWTPFNSDSKRSVRIASSGDIDVNTTDIQSLMPEVTLVDDDRILLKSQSDATQNGIYVVSGTSIGRASDFSSGVKSGSFVFVEEGNFAGSGWLLTTANPITIGSTSLTFTRFNTTATTNALGSYNTNGLLTQTAANTFTGRTLTGTANELTVTNGDGVSGNPTISLPSALTFTGKTVTGGTFNAPTINIDDDAFVLRDDGDTTKVMLFELSGITTATTRTLTVPNASGTIALTSDLTSGYQPLDSTLTSLASYNTNGILTQTAADTFTGRTITGTASRISMTNGNGVSGNPTIDIDSGYVGQTSITTLGTVATGTWNGTLIGVGYGGTGTSTTFTAGSIVFAGTSGVYSQDNANFFWDNTNKRLGIGTASPAAPLEVRTPLSGYGAIFRQHASNISLIQYQNSSGSAIMSVTPDGSNAHHYWTQNPYFNFSGGATGMVVNGTLASMGAFTPNGGIQMGGTAYATAGNQLTSAGILFYTFAWNGSDGYTLGSVGTLRIRQVSAANNSAKFEYYNDVSGQIPFSVDQSGNAAFLGNITTGVWNGTLIGVGYGGTGTATAFTAGSVVFAGASGVYSQDNVNLFWDDSNNRLGIGTAAPAKTLEVLHASAAQLRLTQAAASKYAELQVDSSGNLTQLLTSAGAGLILDHATDTSILYLRAVSGGTTKLGLLAEDASGNLALRNSATGGGLYFDAASGGTFFRNSAFATTLSITDGGLVGVGGTASTLLEIKGASTPRFTVTDTTTPTSIQLLADDTSGYLGTSTNHPIQMFFNNGAVAHIFTTTGRLGLGTTTPQNVLDVEGSLAVGATYSGTTAAPTNGMIVQGKVGIGTSSPNSSFQLHVSALPVLASGGMTVGSGTTAPGGSRLRVDQTEGANGAAVMEFYNGTGAFYMFLESNASGGRFRLRSDSSTSLLIQDNTTTSGGLGVGQESPAAKLHVTSYDSTQITGIFQAASGQTSNLVQFRNSAGSVLGFITADASTIQLPGFSLKNSNGVVVYASFDNVYGTIMPTFGTRTDTSGTPALCTVGGSSSISNFTWSPNAANTCSYSSFDTLAILNAGGSNSGGTYYGIRAIVTETSVTGLTARKLFSGGTGSVGSYTEKFYVNTAGDVFAAGTLSVANSGIKIYDTNASHRLILAVGSDLTADRTLTITTGDANRTLTISSDSTVSADTQTATITYVIDGGGSTITTGIKGDLEIPFPCTINGVTMLADQTGSTVVDIWADSYANYPPVDADSITASATPTISAAIKSQDYTLTGWTTSIASGTILRFNVDSCATIQRLTISLKVTKT